MNHRRWFLVVSFSVLLLTLIVLVLPSSKPNLETLAEQVQEGMPYEQVEAIMGQPQYVEEPWYEWRQGVVGVALRLEQGRVVGDVRVKRVSPIVALYYKIGFR